MGYYQTFLDLLSQHSHPTIEAQCLTYLKDGLPQPDANDPVYVNTSTPIPMNITLISSLRGEDNGTFLHLAAKRGYINLCRRMVQLGFAVNYQRNADGYTPLMIAAYYGYPELASILLSMGADPNLRSKDGTALAIAQNTQSISEAVSKRVRSHQEIVSGRQAVARIINPPPALRANLLTRMPPHQAATDRIPPQAARHHSPPPSYLSATSRTPASFHDIPDDDASVPSVNTLQRLWNGVVSFVAGLTLIYPLIKTIQYFWKKHKKELRKVKESDYPGAESSDFSWCEHYTASLTFLGYRNTPFMDDGDSSDNSCFVKIKRAFTLRRSFIDQSL